MSPEELLSNLSCSPAPEIPEPTVQEIEDWLKWTKNWHPGVNQVTNVGLTRRYAQLALEALIAKRSPWLFRLRNTPYAAERRNRMD